MSFDTTQLVTFLDCPERYKQKYVNLLKKRQEDAYELPKTFGSAIHTGLAAHYAGKTPEGVLSSFASVFQNTVEGETLRTQAHGVSLLTEYLAYAKQNDTPWKVLDIEPVLEYPLGPVAFIVKPDLILDTPSGIWSVDHKTTQKLPTEQFWRRFEPNSQITAQCWATQQKYGQCSGVIINALCFGYRTRAYKGEPPGFWCRFERQVFNRTQEQVADWQARNLRTIARIEQTKLSGAWEKNESQCGFCEYRQLCMSCDNPGVREVLYESHDAYAYLKEEPVHG